MSTKKKKANEQTGEAGDVPFFRRPTKTVLIIFTSLWALATFLILAAATNAFTEPLFPVSTRFYILFALVLYNTWAVFALYRNYFIHQRTLRDEEEAKPAKKGKKQK